MELLSQRILLLTGWKRYGLAFLVGALFALTTAPFQLWFAGFFSFPVLVWLLDGAVANVNDGWLKRRMPAFSIGLVYGFGYFLASLWWIGGALLVEAPEFAWAIPFASAGIPFLLAIFYGVATAAARMVWSDGVGRLFGLAAFLGLADWLRSFVLSGFPWNTIGNALMPTPLMMQPVAVVSIFGMSALAVLLFSLPALFSKGRGHVVFALLLGSILLGGQFGYGMWRMQTAEAVAQGDTVYRLVQPSIDQSSKATPEDAVKNFEIMRELTSLPPQGDAPEPDVILWPETAVPFILTREPDALAAIADTLKDGQVLLTGAIREEVNEEAETSRFYNSAMVISADGVITDAADKMHLVPFGEYLPLRALLTRFDLRTIAAADRGYYPANERKLIDLSGQTILPVICYEVIFPELLEPAKSGSINAIINLTNDAWFGRTPGPWQHLYHAQLRAVETGRPLVRVANSGVSAVFDGLGRPIHMVALDERGAIDFNLPDAFTRPIFMQKMQYNQWLLFGFFAAIAFLGSRRRKAGFRHSR